MPFYDNDFEISDFGQDFTEQLEFGSEKFTKHLIFWFAKYLTKEISKVTPVDTGLLRNSIKKNMRIEGHEIIWTMPEYFNWVEWGVLDPSPKQQNNMFFFQLAIENNAQECMRKAFHKVLLRSLKK